MSLTKEEVLNVIYNSGLITLGSVIVSVASLKLFKDSLGVKISLKDVFRSAAAVGGGSLLVKILQKKEYVPAEPFKA